MTCYHARRLAQRSRVTSHQRQRPFCVFSPVIGIAAHSVPFEAFEQKTTGTIDYWSGPLVSSAQRRSGGAHVGRLWASVASALYRTGTPIWPASDAVGSVERIYCGGYD